MSAWLLVQGTQACRSRVEEFFFDLVLGAIYIFSFFNVKDEPTRNKYILFYSFCFVENTCLITFWFLYANSNLGIGETHWYWIPGMVGHYVMFFSGIFFMVTYYVCFHPSGVEMPRALRQIKKGARRRRAVSEKDRRNNGAEPEVKPQFVSLCDRAPTATAAGDNNTAGSRKSLSSSTPSHLDELDAPDHATAGAGRTAATLPPEGSASGRRGGHPTVRKTSSAPTQHQGIAEVRTLKSIW